MLPFDTIVILTLYYVPLIAFFLWTSKVDYNNTVWLSVWVIIQYYIIYKSYDYVNEPVFLSLFLAAFVLTNLLGLRLFMDQSLSEETGMLSPVPYRFTLKSVRETCLELQSDWYCLKTNGGSVKIGDVWVNCKIEKLKRGILVGVKGTPDSESYFKSLVTGFIYSIFFVYFNYLAPSFEVSFYGYPVYVPLFSLLFSLAIGLFLSGIRRDILRVLSLTLIKLRAKLRKAKEVYERLQMIALAERIKERERKKKIKQALEMARALEIAKKISEKTKHEETEKGDGENEE